MKIALLGSAPSSLGLAPFGDPAWKIWACSPGTYFRMPRCDAFFELHRWEPGLIGKPDSQKPWFSPEYVMWMAHQKLVWMAAVTPGIPGSRALPFVEMNKRWGSYFWTSSLAYMAAMALDEIIAERAARAASGMSQEEQDRVSVEDCIGFWGVDMAATEEYGYQRAGCQHFICEANRLGIGVLVPPESDLLRPMPPYGLFESTHFMIKATERERELVSRVNGLMSSIANQTQELHFVKGALDNHRYHMQTWGTDRDGLAAAPEVAHLQAKVIADLAPAPSASVVVEANLNSTVGSLANAQSTGAEVVPLRADQPDPADDSPVQVESVKT